MPYLNAQAIEGLKRHKYSCVDVNLLTKYVLQPFWWSKLLARTPLWVAPNVITLTGFAFVVLAAVISLSYFPYMVWVPGSVPSWVFFLMGLGVFAYSSLDAIDGQQARRTGAGSTLGELLDHSIDAVATGLVMPMLTAAMGAGDWPALFGIVFAGFMFWVVTWEEYITGSLNIWYFSGAVDGPFNATLMLMLPGVAENCYRFASSWTFGMPLGNFALQVLVPVFSALSCITNVITARQSLPGKHNHTFTEAMAKWLGPLSMALLFLAIAYNDPWILQLYITPYLLVVTFSFVHLSWHLLLAHITETDYDPFTIVFIPLGLAFLNSIFKIIPVELMIYGHLIFLAAVLLHYAISVIRELSRALDVPVFSIKRKELPSFS